MQEVGFPSWNHGPVCPQAGGEGPGAGEPWSLLDGHILAPGQDGAGSSDPCRGPRALQSWDKGAKVLWLAASSSSQGTKLCPGFGGHGGAGVVLHQ